MAATIAPSVEASQAIVDRINDSTTFALEVVAERLEMAVDHLEEVNGLRVDVVHEEETQLEETLDEETEHRTKSDLRAVESPQQNSRRNRPVEIAHTADLPAG